MRVGPAIHDVLGGVDIPRVARGVARRWWRPAGRDGEVVVMPGAAGEVELVNMRVGPAIHDVLGGVDVPRVARGIARRRRGTAGHDGEVVVMPRAAGEVEL